MATVAENLKALCELRRRDEPPARVVSGFPGVGKTGLFIQHPGRVSDSDSSHFAKGPGFAREYIRHIRYQRDLPDIRLVLVSSHDVVRSALAESGIPFTLAYPETGLKDEYLLRYMRRGSPPQFIEMMDRSWSSFIGQCEAQVGCEHVRLRSGQFLGDVIAIS